jgi:D-amino-acid dehydrogenase
MNKEIVIIGGGIIGLCSAYYLQKDGHQISIIDRSNLDSGASYVNAGFLAPSHIIPLSAPGVMKKGLKWMLNPASPLYIKPRLDLDFLKWAWAFNKACNPKHVKKAIPIIKDIALLSQDLYVDIKESENFNFHYEKKGLLMLCQSEKMLNTEIEVAQMAQKEGLDVSILDIDDLKKLEPNVRLNVKGATYYTCDSHSTPHEFMDEMKAYLKSVGVLFYTNEKVTDLEVKEGKIHSVKTDKQVIKGDEYVMAAGSWTGLLSKKLGLKLLLQAGKGYRINTYRPTGISVPAILAEAKGAVSPMHGFTRFSGTMEIAGINEQINPVRVEAIARAANSYYPHVQLTKEEMDQVECGLRPLSIDGLPYIGRAKNCDNLVVATGHAMLGWTMGTGTGKLVSEIISNRKTSMSLEPFAVERTN